jgi:3-oxoacyl-[acyl-carrier-protein] synthase II
VSALITASSVRTCFGNGEATFAALLGGISGVRPLRYYDAEKLGVSSGYQIPEPDPEAWFRASRWLEACVAEVLAQSAIDPSTRRVVAVVGTGLRELRAVERWTLDSMSFSPDRLHFSDAVRRVSPHIAEVVTLSNACSAGGHALAVAQDMIELREADAVLVAGTDATTESMLAMIGRFADSPTQMVRPFDAGRTGVLLGEGAAALIIEAENSPTRPLGRLLSTGLSCDACHETAPDAEGIRRALEDALRRADRAPDQIDLIVTHGTGTSLNDPIEAAVIRSVFAQDSPGPWITGIKGAVGHTSGGSALLGVDVALRCLRSGVAPPVIGLRRPLSEGEGLRFVIGEPVEAPLKVANVHAFGFGGVNSITVLEKPA